MATTNVTLASGNRVKHSKVREAAFGVTPTSPAMKNLRVTNSTLQPNIETVVSQELRTDRQIPDQTLVAVKASGDINFELSFAALDDFFEEVFQGVWLTKPAIVNTAAGTPISNATASTITVASGGGAFLANSLAMTAGFVNAANNLLGILVPGTGTTVVFTGATTFVTDASPQIGAAVRVVGKSGASGDIAATSTGLTSVILDFTTLSMAVGDWINIGGALAINQFATAANNSFARITSIKTNVILLDNLPAGWAADAGAGKFIYIFFGDSLVNGTTLWTSTIERNYTDQGTPTFEYYTGSATDKMSLSMSASQIITGSVSVVCQNASFLVSRAAGATDVLAPTYPVLNATSNFARIGLGGVVVSGPNYVMAATVEIANNISPNMALGNLGAVALTNGDFNLSGSLNVYFGDTSLLATLLSNAPTALNFIISDTLNTNESYILSMPQVKLSSGTINDVSKNRAVMQAIGYRAILSPTYGYTAKITRFWFTA